MKTPVSSIALFALAAVLGAAGQFLYKSGAARITDSLWSFLNLRLVGGVVCYVAVMVLFVAAFKRGGELTVLYPVYASTFIWASIISGCLWHTDQANQRRRNGPPCGGHVLDGEMIMATETYEPTDRRPIASRDRKFWQAMAARLAARRVSPNAISVAGMAAGIVAGLLLVATSFVEAGWPRRVLWLGAAATMQLRLLANMLDGMVAIASRRASPVGELYNELPDRVSDAAIMIGAGYAVGGWPVLGYVAACVAILTAYVRAVGKAAGASNLFVGPMAKPHRMFVLTLVALLMAALPVEWQPCWGASHASFPAVGLAIIIVGGLVTVLRRVALIVRHLQGPA